MAEPVVVNPVPRFQLPNAPAAFELRVMSESEADRIIPLKGDQLTVGRSSANALAFPHDSSLSRNHLMFEREGSTWLATDLGSRNGTLVNGDQLQGRRHLTAGDLVQAGAQTFEFRPAVAAGAGDTVYFVPQKKQAQTSEVVIDLESLINEGTAGEDPGKSQPLAGSHIVKALLRAGEELSEQRTLDELCDTILDLALESVGGKRGVLMTIDNDDNLALRASRGENFKISSTIRDQVIGQKASILVRDVFDEANLREQESIIMQQIRSIIVVPLQTRQHVLGLIYVDKADMIAPFNDQDLKLLTVMANIAAIRIEQARLQEVERSQQEMARDLSQAGEIQAGLLPKTMPESPGADIAGRNFPCRGVGGDYFDAITYRDGRVGLIVGDVAGKGMPAALLMTSLQSMVSVLAKSATHSPAEMVEDLNRNITERCPGNRFITFFLAVFDPYTGGLNYCNAGHNPPVLVRADGAIESLPESDMILGILPNAEYHDYRALLRPGDVLAMFSDGITEACPTGSDDEFGEERLGKVIAKHRAKSAEEIIDAVMDAVEKFAKGAPFADDVTLVIAKSTAHGLTLSSPLSASHPSPAHA